MNGLHSKYIVQKVDGSPIDVNAFYFVLRLDTDICARCAMREYAHCTADAKLAEDLLVVLKYFEMED